MKVKDMGIKEQVYLILAAVLWVFTYILREFEGGVISSSLGFLAVCFITMSICGWMIAASRRESGD